MASSEGDNDHLSCNKRKKTPNFDARSNPGQFQGKYQTKKNGNNKE